MLALRQDSIAALAHQMLAIEARPRDPDLVFNHALVYLARGQTRDARAAFANTLKLDPAHQRATAKLREIGAMISGAVEPGRANPHAD
jgi:Flp pilus assembly protein TadD